VRSTIRRTLLLCLVCAVAWASVVSGHPHGPDTTVIYTGKLTKVDLEKQIIELDTVDPKTLTAINVLLFVEPKAKLRQGKRRIVLSDLGAGQRVTCVAEREEDTGNRLVAFDIRLLDKPAQ
jgi:hypothetical protein